ncbi:MAG: hypothetical protein PHI12_06740 [Dehalococcoidales bacterium]|nr:hypothetical protein [Dehalococcoidales bacterium]
MPDVKEIRDYFLSELEGSSTETRRVRLFWCDRFLKYAHRQPLSDWDKRLVTSFMRKLEEEKYTPLTIRNAMGVVKRVFDTARAVHEQERTKLIASVDASDPTALAEVLKAMAMPGPVWNPGKRFLPEVNGSDITKPEMSREELMLLVNTARLGKLDPSETAFLAVSSVYGFRAGELRAILPEHIDYAAGTIWRQTEKGGEKRNQALAPCLVPYLKEYDFSLEYSPYMINKVFHSICKKAGVEKVYHKAWHSLRHRVLIDIRDTFASRPELKMEPELVAKIFLAWKQSTAAEMVDRYYTKSPLEVDKLVIKYSPAVRLWS